MVWVFLALFVVLLIVLVFLILYLKNKGKENKKEVEEKIHTTQELLPFEYIRRGVVKLKSGQYIRIMQVASINTQLMEEDEKEVVRETYAGFLNSLDFKIQFYKQSRLVDINDYLSFLKEKELAAENQFKLKGIVEYSNFIKTLVKENSVQTKKDFLVISWSEATNKAKNSTNDSMRKYRKNDDDSNNREEESHLEEQRTFEKAYKILTQRESSLQKQLIRFGIKPKSLKDKDLFELFYIAYNKERSVYQSLKGVDPNNYTTLYSKMKKEDE